MTITPFQERSLWLALASLSGLYFWWITAAGLWPYGADGKLLTFDFSPVWAAGHRVLSGEAMLVYDLPAHDAYQGALRGTKPPEDLPFAYPPAVLWLASPLALFDYGTAMAIYLLGGYLLFAALLTKVSGDWLTGAAMGLAIGGPTATIWLGQNGFLTASAITAGLLLKRRHPLVAGISFGLLTLKPHLAVVAFGALFLWRDWKVLAAAIGTAVVLTALPVLVYGPAAWIAYAEAGQGIVAIIERHYDRLVGHMMQSIYAAMAPHVGLAPAMAVQLAFAALALLATAVIPASKTDERAAAMIAATLLATPYAFPYDATMLVAGTAFLLRGSRNLWLHVAGAVALLWIGSWFVRFGSLVPLSAAVVLGLAVARGRPLHWRLWREPREPTLQCGDCPSGG
jgi:hypothetical protein